MATLGLNILRWSSLAFGVVYGVSHQSVITKRDQAAIQKREWSLKEAEILKAKQEFSRINCAATVSQQSDSTRDAGGQAPVDEIEAFLTGQLK